MSAEASPLGRIAPGLECRALRAGASWRLGVFAAQALEAGSVVEECYALPIPAWQANPEFTWACGAFAASGPSAMGSAPEVTPFSGQADAALLALGWGMAYADTRRVSRPANVGWRCEARQGARWVVLSTTAAVAAGEELVRVWGRTAL